MTAFGSQVSGRGDDYDSLLDCFFGGLVDDAFRAGNIFVAAQRDVQDSNAVAFTVFDDPTDPARDVVLCNPALLPRIAIER